MPATDALGPIKSVTTSGAGVTAAAGTSLAHHLFSKVFTFDKSLTNVKHLGFPSHTFVHWKGFAPAAPRGARASISVPFSRLPLSWPLLILGLVVHYTANYLISRQLILRHCFYEKTHSSRILLSSVNLSFPRIS